MSGSPQQPGETPAQSAGAEKEDLVEVAEKPPVVCQVRIRKDGMQPPGLLTVNGKAGNMGDLIILVETTVEGRLGMIFEHSTTPGKLSPCIPDDYSSCPQDALYAKIINEQWADIEIAEFKDQDGVVTLRYERSCDASGDEGASSSTASSSTTTPSSKTTRKASSFSAQEESPSPPSEPRRRHDRVAKGKCKDGTSKKVSSLSNAGGSRKIRAPPESSPEDDERDGYAIVCTSDDEPPARKVARKGGSKNRTRQRDLQPAPAKKKKKRLKKVPANAALTPASKEPTDFQRFRSLVHKRVTAGLTARGGGGTIGESSRRLAGWWRVLNAAFDNGTDPADVVVPDPGAQQQQQPTQPVVQHQQHQQQPVTQQQQPPTQPVVHHQQQYQHQHQPAIQRQQQQHQPVAQQQQPQPVTQQQQPAMQPVVHYQQQQYQQPVVQQQQPAMQPVVHQQQQQYQPVTQQQQQPMQPVVHHHQQCQHQQQPAIQHQHQQQYQPYGPPVIQQPH